MYNSLPCSYFAASHWDRHSYFPSHLNELLTCIYKATSVLPDPPSQVSGCSVMNTQHTLLQHTNKVRQTKPNWLKMKYRHEPLRITQKVWSYDILYLVLEEQGWLEPQIFKNAAEMLSGAYYLVFQRAKSKSFSPSLIWFYHFLYSSVVVDPTIWAHQGSGEMPRKGNFDTTHQSEEQIKTRYQLAETRQSETSLETESYFQIVRVK